MNTPALATRFARIVHVVRSDLPLVEEQMRLAAPSIFALGKHASRSERYTYIPTIEVLRGLRKEGFEAFMVAQSMSRIAGKTEFTKHMIRMRYVAQVEARGEATTRSFPAGISTGAFTWSSKARTINSSSAWLRHTKEPCTSVRSLVAHAGQLQPRLSSCAGSWIGERFVKRFDKCVAHAGIHPFTRRSFCVDFQAN